MRKEKYDYDLEARRKIFHLILGILVVILIQTGILTPLRIFLILVFGGFLSIISRSYKIPIIYWFLERFERKEQLKRIPGKGALSFFTGVLLAVKLFPRDIALASIIILTVGDSLSHIYGKFFGRKRIAWNKEKMVEGNLFGALISGFSASIFTPLISSMIASFTTMMFESVELRIKEEIIDDNIMVPLIAGTIMLIIRNLFPYINII